MADQELHARSAHRRHGSTGEASWRRPASRHQRVPGCVLRRRRWRRRRWRWRRRAAGSPARASPARPSRTNSSSTTGRTTSPPTTSRRSRRPTSRSSPTTRSRQRELLAKLQAGGGGYDIGAPHGGVHRADGRGGLIEKIDRSRSRTCSTWTPGSRSCGGTPTTSTRCPRTRARPESRCATSSSPRRSSPGRSSSRSPRSTAARSSWSTRWATSWSCRSRCWQLAELGRPGGARTSPRALSGLAPHVLALNSDTYEEPIQNEEAVLGLAWTGRCRAERRGGDRRHGVHGPEEGTLYWIDSG